MLTDTIATVRVKGGHVTCPCSLNAPLRRSTAGSLLQPTSTLDAFFFKLENLPSSQVEGIRNHWKMHPSARRLDDVDAILKFAQLLREYEDQGALVWMRRASRKGHPLATWTLCSDSPWWPDDEKNMVQVVFGPFFFAKLI